jgi:hypothetical protein
MVIDPYERICAYMYVHIATMYVHGRMFGRTVPRIYEIWSRLAPTFIWPIRPVCQCRSLNELLKRKLSYGQVTCARSLRELPIRLQSGSRIDQISSMRGTAGGLIPVLRQPSTRHLGPADQNAIFLRHSARRVHNSFERSREVCFGGRRHTIDARYAASVDQTQRRFAESHGDTVCAMERQPRRRLATSTRRCRASGANRFLHKSSVYPRVSKMVRNRPNTRTENP